MVNGSSVRSWPQPQPGNWDCCASGLTQVGGYHPELPILSRTLCLTAFGQPPFKFVFKMLRVLLLVHLTPTLRTRFRYYTISSSPPPWLHYYYYMRRGYAGTTRICSKMAGGYNSMNNDWNEAIGGSKEAHGFGESFLKCLRPLGHAVNWGILICA